MNKVLDDQVDDLRTILGLAVLDDMLGNVVTILILDKLERSNVKFVKDRSLGLLVAVLQHPLDHAAAVRVGCQRMHLVGEGIYDEVNVFGRNALDGFLNDMIPVLILDTLEDVALQLFNQLGLLVDEDVLESLRKWLV